MLANWFFPFSNFLKLLEFRTKTNHTIPSDSVVYNRWPWTARLTKSFGNLLFLSEAKTVVPFFWIFQIFSNNENTHKPQFKNIIFCNHFNETPDVRNHHFNLIFPVLKILSFHFPSDKSVPFKTWFASNANMLLRKHKAQFKIFQH